MLRGPNQVSKANQWQLKEDLSGGDYLDPQYAFHVPLCNH
jgi:hypothetical protein